MLMDYCAETPRLRNKLPSVLNLQERSYLTNLLDLLGTQVTNCGSKPAKERNAIV